MPELDELLRDFIDLGATPVRADEILRRPPARRLRLRTRPHPTSLWRPVGVAVATVAVVVSLIGFATTRSGEPPSPRSGVAVRGGSSASTSVLDHAAAAADDQQPLVPGPGQHLYVRTLVGSEEATAFTPGQRMSRFYVQEMHETWTAPHSTPSDNWTVVGQPEFISGADRAAWVAAGSPPVKSGYGGGGTAPYYDVTDLPTDPGRMAAYFASQPYLQVDAKYGRDAAWEFEAAVDFLQAGASSKQRGALLRFMATLPGVRATGTSTTIGTDLSGETLQLPANARGLEVEAILDPQTSELLELRSIVADAALYQNIPSPSQVAADHAVPPWQDGEADSYVDFLYAGIADRAGYAPSSAPPAPVGWPFGSSRTPLPGSAYP
jgi:hypothetical protein